MKDAETACCRRKASSVRLMMVVVVKLEVDNEDVVNGARLKFGGVAWLSNHKGEGGRFFPLFDVFGGQSDNREYRFLACGLTRSRCKPFHIAAECSNGPGMLDLEV